jgi:hypothetical protein
MRWLLALIGLTAATPALATGLPTPPEPPAQASRSIAAPIPDSDFHAPPAPAETGPTIGLKFYRLQNFDPGLGFAPGSRYQMSEDRKQIQTPGFSVSVPLE